MIQWFSDFSALCESRNVLAATSCSRPNEFLEKYNDFQIKILCECKYQLRSYDFFPYIVNSSKKKPWELVYENT